MITDDVLNKEVETVERLNILEEQKTNRKKKQFLDEIKGGLGKKIKANPNGLVFKKETKWGKFKAIIKNIFTKF
jgi:hypothetical protein